MSCQTPYLGEDRRVNRIRAVQQALGAPVKRIYLEIGVWHGFVLWRITADEKIAVDRRSSSPCAPAGSPTRRRAPPLLRNDQRRFLRDRGGLPRAARHRRRFVE
jgi:hypothetical protein